MTVESDVEKHFVKLAKENKAWALKFTSPGTRGVPDRIVIRYDGGIEFVELKKPGESLRPSQKVVKKILERYGHTVTVLDTKADVTEYWRLRRA